MLGDEPVGAIGSAREALEEEGKRLAGWKHSGKRGCGCATREDLAGGQGEVPRVQPLRLGDAPTEVVQQ